MANARVPAELLNPVVAHFRPQRVILFGSRARGSAHRDSDIDLLVIVDDDTPPEKLTWRAGYEAHRSARYAADVIPMRAATFERNRNIPGTLAAEADADGIVVFGPTEGASSMKSPDPRAKWEAVEDWLAVAEKDRRAAEICLAAGSSLFGVTAFHCQQAAEKLLKGFLTLAGKRSGKTHSLAQLGDAAQASFPEIAEMVNAARSWTSWAFEFRYPAARGRAEPLPEEEELRHALVVINAMIRRLRAANPEPPGP